MAPAKHIFALMLSPRGRIDRADFIFGVAVLALLLYGQRIVYAHLQPGMAQFWIGMIFFFLNLQFILCIYGKRLHDLGRSLWPLIALFMITIFIAIIVMLNFGGLEYFNTLYDNPTIPQDPAAMQAVRAEYERALSAARPKIKIILAIAPILFTVWLAIAKGQAGANRYGEPPRGAR